MNPTGVYTGTVKKIVATKSSNGTKCMACVFDITQYAVEGQWTEIEAIERTVYLYLSEKAKKHTYQKIASFGLEEGKIKLTRDEASGEALIVLPEGTSDTPITLECKHEDYQGEMKERWDWESWGGGIGEALSDEELMEWQAIL